jgi:hypothetical protein
MDLLKLPRFKHKKCLCIEPELCNIAVILHYKTCDFCNTCAETCHFSLPKTIEEKPNCFVAISSFCSTELMDRYDS